MIKIKSLIPASFNWSMMMLKMVLPASGINALGCVYVWGRSLVPAPATGIIAFMYAHTRTRVFDGQCIFSSYGR